MFLVGSLALVQFLSAGFMPTQDDGQTQVSLEPAPGSTLEDTARIAQKASTLIKQIPDVTHIFSSVGSAS